MTRLVQLSELTFVGDGAVMCTKDNIQKNDIVIAQSESSETSYIVINSLEQEYLKKGYSMLILTEKEGS